MNLRAITLLIYVGLLMTIWLGWGACNSYRGDNQECAELMVSYSTVPLVAMLVRDD